MKLKFLSLICALELFAFGTNAMAQDATSEAPAAPTEEVKGSGDKEADSGKLPVVISVPICTAVKAVNVAINKIRGTDLNSCCTDICTSGTLDQLKYCFQAVNLYMNNPTVDKKSSLYAAVTTFSSAANKVVTTVCGGTSCKLTSSVEQACADIGCNVGAGETPDIKACLAAVKPMDMCINHTPIMEKGKMQPSLKCLNPAAKKSAI